MLELDASFTDLHIEIVLLNVGLLLVIQIERSRHVPPRSFQLGLDVVNFGPDCLPLLSHKAMAFVQFCLGREWSGLFFAIFALFLIFCDFCF